MIRSIREAVKQGEPLIDILVKFKEGMNYETATAAINSLGPDIDLHSGNWYGSANTRIGSVTAEGALRLFKVKFRRVPHETNAVFMWHGAEIRDWPIEVASYVEAISVPQPGANDDGQFYLPEFDR